jgi:diguanylate cyclase (GGDEF)-like protein/PAS domain S-box-containing protein
MPTMEHLESIIAENLFESNHILMLMTDAHANITMANQYALSLMGYTREEIQGMSIRDIHLSDASYERFIEQNRTDLRKGALVHFEYPFRCKNGQTVWLSASGKCIDAEGSKLWTAIDISERKQMEQKLAEFKERLEYAIEANQDVVWDWDINANVLNISDRWKDLSGYSRADTDYIVKTWRKFLHPEDRRIVLKKLQASLDGKSKYVDFVYRFLHKNGKTIWILMRALTLYDENNKAYRMVGTHRDVTRTKELEMQTRKQSRTIEQQRDALWHRAHHDVLTELPNRVYCQKLLEDAIINSQKTHKQFAFLFADVDRFKHINDTFGHNVGDIVLQYVANTLRQGVRSSDIVARLGGDEFTLILQEIEGRKTIEGVAQQLIKLFERPFEHQGRLVPLSVSIGIAVYPQDGETAQTLLHHADTAMYRVKEQGRGSFCFYGHSPHRH